MAKNYKGEEIPERYGSDELLWRLCEFSESENEEYFADKNDAKRFCDGIGLPLQPLTEEIVREYADKFLHA